MRKCQCLLYLSRSFRLRKLAEASFRSAVCILHCPNEEDGMAVLAFLASVNFGTHGEGTGH